MECRERTLAFLYSKVLGVWGSYRMLKVIQLCFINKTIAFTARANHRFIKTN